MKQKIFSTNKADILVVDLPKNAGWIKITKNILYYSFYQKKKKHNESILIPHGNWQPLTFDEETAKKIVKCISLNTGWMNYKAPPYIEYLFKTALESLQSLIDANVQKVNQYSKPRELDDFGQGILPNELYQEDLGKWKHEEENTYHNPFYFFKLK